MEQDALSQLVLLMLNLKVCFMQTGTTASLHISRHAFFTEGSRLPCSVYPAKGRVNLLELESRIGIQVLKDAIIKWQQKVQLHQPRLSMSDCCKTLCSFRFMLTLYGWRFKLRLCLHALVGPCPHLKQSVLIALNRTKRVLVFAAMLTWLLCNPCVLPV